MSAVTRKCRQLARNRTSAAGRKCRHLLGRRPSGYLRQHAQDVFLDPPDFGLNFFERAGRRVAVEVAVEVDLVADKADAAVLWIDPAGIGPGVRHGGFDLTVEKVADTGRDEL